MKSSGVYKEYFVNYIIPILTCLNLDRFRTMKGLRLAPPEL